jgi:hypothetical protein
MPRGPKSEKRPADVVGAAVMVGRIATGEIPPWRWGAWAARPGLKACRPRSGHSFCRNLQIGSEVSSRQKRPIKLPKVESSLKYNP